MVYEEVDGSIYGYFRQAINLLYKDTHVKRFNNLTVTHTLGVYTTHKTAFLELLPKLQLRIRHIILTHQQFSMKECNLLANLNLESVCFDAVKIFKCEVAREVMSAEEIITQFSSCDNIE